MPGISFEYDLYKKYVPGITLAEVNAFAKEWMGQSQNSVVIISTAPEKETTKMPTETRIREMVTGMEKLDLKPYEDKVIDKPLVEGQLKGGTVVNTKEIKELGITEWQLDNGIKVACKTTDFKNDEVIFTSFSWGGWSQYDEKDYPSAASCDPQPKPPTQACRHDRYPEQVWCRASSRVKTLEIARNDVREERTRLAPAMSRGHRAMRAGHRLAAEAVAATRFRVNICRLRLNG